MKSLSEIHPATMNKNIILSIQNRLLLLQKPTKDSEKSSHMRGSFAVQCALKDSRSQRYTSGRTQTISHLNIYKLHLNHLVMPLIAILVCATCVARAEDLQQSSTTSSLLEAVADLKDEASVGEAKLIENAKLENKFQRRSEVDEDDRAMIRRDSADDDIDFGNDDPKLITKEPRQQFKIHLAPVKSQKRSFKSMVAKRQQQTGNGSTDTTAKPGATGSSRVKAKSGKQMLSSEMLKKLLLNQGASSKNPASLFYTGSLNGTSVATGGFNQTGKAGSNFKFVFIQRASATPAKGSASSNSTKNDSANSINHQSLAASVSKQLASSLLYSAANLVGNLTSAPSISALTNAVSIKSPGNTETGGASGSVNSYDGSNDIRRVQILPSATGVTRTSSSVASGRKQRPSRRPSKVYNLPVKFVANGQPNGVVFHAIKQHFATIKKMQSVAAAAAAAASNSDRKTTTFMGSKDRRKQQQSDRKKWKGGNSRLIYLPIKYISNARPERLISPKAAHKSVSNA